MATFETPVLIVGGGGFGLATSMFLSNLGLESLLIEIASLQEDKAQLTSEAADLLFHLLVLLADAGLSLADVAAELERREGMSGIAEKASRPS